MRTFLKWAGGKRQLLPRLRPVYPSTFGVYHEPFLGSGAVFFDLVARGHLDNRPAVLTDENPDLIGTWLRVRDSVGLVLAALERLARGHARDGADHYRRVRDRQFNPARRQWYDAGADLAAYRPEMAAMLIYLNRTGYNGLFRVNRAGGFNVPPGRYTSTRAGPPARNKELYRCQGPRDWNAGCQPSYWQEQSAVRALLRWPVAHLASLLRTCPLIRSRSL